MAKARVQPEARGDLNASHARHQPSHCWKREPKKMPCPFPPLGEGWDGGFWDRRHPTNQPIRTQAPIPAFPQRGKEQDTVYEREMSFSRPFPQQGRHKILETPAERDALPLPAFGGRSKTPCTSVKCLSLAPSLSREDTRYWKRQPKEMPCPFPPLGEGWDGGFWGRRYPANQPIRTQAPIPAFPQRGKGQEKSQRVRLNSQKFGDQHDLPVPRP